MGTELEFGGGGGAFRTMEEVDSDEEGTGYFAFCVFLYFILFIYLFW